jgi:hypothetical protein
MEPCCPPPETKTGRVCPSCGEMGTAVDVTTVRAMLVPEALARMEPANFNFCAAPWCGVVYFSSTGPTFGIADLHVPVWQKSAPGARMVCYCFGENEADIRREIEDTGRTAAIERVRGHIADHRCACTVRNPRGVCCLRDLIATTKDVSLRARARA